MWQRSGSALAAFLGRRTVDGEIHAELAVNPVSF